MHFPKQYWTNAVLIACYLINHMSSSMLNNQVPFVGPKALHLNFDDD